MKNIITVKLTLNERGLRKFRNIPTFKNLLHSSQLSDLRSGENILNVNHTVWGSLQRVTGYDSNNMNILKVA